MKPKYHHQCCPSCGQQVSWARLNLFPWIWSQWKCESCNTKLKFSSENRLICALLAVAWTGFLSFFILHHVAQWVYLIVLCVGLIGIFRFDRIIVAEPVQKIPKGEDLHASPPDV